MTAIPEVSAEGAILLDGLPAEELANEYGTPLFVLLEQRLRSNARALREAFHAAFPRGELYYAVKANPLQRVLAILREEGFGAEVMSAMEDEFCRRAGFERSRLIFNGPAKSDAELGDALRRGVRLHLDSLEEAVRAAELARSSRLRPAVGVRLHPELPEEVERRAYVTKASKLGVDPDLGVKLFRTAAPALDPDGIHLHVGTDQRDPLLHAAVASFARDYVERLRREGFGVGRVNLGGGMAARMDLAVELPAYLNGVKKGLGELEATIEMEPGRVLVGDAVAALARVVRVKRTWGKSWVLLDAGANTLVPLRYTRYRTLSHRPAPRAPVDVGGPLCLPVDVVETNARIAPEEGDVVAVLNAGAYTLTLGSSFGQPRPAVVAVAGGRHALVRQRERVEDLARFDREVPW